MRPAFVSGLLFPGNCFLSRAAYRRLLSSPSKRWQASTCTTVRYHREAVECARVNAHREIKSEIDQSPEDLVNTLVTISTVVRHRCSLTKKLSRVKVFIEKTDLEDISTLKGSVRSRLVRIFPELEQRGLLREHDDFDIKIGGGKIVRDLEGMRVGLEKCENSGSPVVIELIPHNLPPLKAPLSDRVGTVKQKAEEAERNPAGHLHMISFYNFVAIERPDLVSAALRKVWSWMRVKGRVYIAAEGVNAQLAVPDEVINDFRECMSGEWKEQGEFLIPREFVGVVLNEGSIVKRSEQPFEKLHVRPRVKVLADGLQEPMDWSRAGNSISPEEWHQELKTSEEDYVLLDCRNDYESDVGHFEGAEPLNTSTFRESWAELEKRLQHEDREKRILTYCTGGIRCVKVNAFLEQKMGFKNTGRLQGGIVSYVRTLRTTGRLHESAFKGVNHVFDGRMGEVITEDLLGECITCGQACNVQKDCANVECPRPFDSRVIVQCEKCGNRMEGTCSPECLDVLRSKRSHLKRSNVGCSPIAAQPQRISLSEKYAEAFTMEETPLMADLRRKSYTEFPGRAHMLSSNAQASLLKLLVQISGATKVLEIGTFTGYATLAMASAVPRNGLVITCEVDTSAANIAEKFFTKDVENREKIRLLRGKALNTLHSLCREGTTSFDFAFIDADKGGYVTYTNFLLHYNLVRIGGLFVFDNVLFRGEVPNMWREEQLSETEVPLCSSNLFTERLSGQKDMRRTAKKLHNFNKYLKQEDRLEQVVLPFRDGLTIARRVR